MAVSEKGYLSISDRDGRVCLIKKFGNHWHRLWMKLRQLITLYIHPNYMTGITRAAKLKSTFLNRPLQFWQNFDGRCMRTAFWYLTCYNAPFKIKAIIVSSQALILMFDFYFKHATDWPNNFLYHGQRIRFTCFVIRCQCLTPFLNDLTLPFTLKMILIRPFTSRSAFFQLNYWMCDVRISKLWWRTPHSKRLSRFFSSSKSNTNYWNTQSNAWVDARHWPIFTLGC